MCAYTFIWCQLSLRSIFMYKLNLHFRRVLIITWHGKQHRAQINVKMFFFQGYVRKISPCKSSIFLPFLSLSGISDPHWNGTEYMVTKNKYFLNHWDHNVTDLMQYFHKNNTSNTRQGKQQMHKMSQFTKLWRHFQADFCCNNISF